MIASLLLIAVYIGFRFEFKFAVPMLIALAHDLLITAGVYALTERELTTATVAALLTIMGYSLYDTIIVFDRIRENVPRMPRATFSQIANRSMSEVLTRSLATSFTVLMPVGALLLFGGETLKDFAFALLVGVASGRLLVDLHRHAGAGGVEGARAGLHAPPPARDGAARRDGARVRDRARSPRSRPWRGAAAARRRGGRATAPRGAGAGRAAAGAEAPRPRRAGGAAAAGRSAASAAPAARAAAAARDRPPARRRPSPPRRPSRRPRARRRRRARRSAEPATPRAARAPADAPPADGAAPRATARRARVAHHVHAGRPRSVQAEAEAAAAAEEARSPMSLIVWVMMGIAVWHFTVFVPDRFWGGIVGAFLAAFVVGRAVRLHRQRRHRARAGATPTSSRR